MFFMRKMICSWRWFVALCLGGGAVFTAAGASLERPLSLQGQAQREAVQSQGKIDKLADQTSDLTIRYKSVLAELDNARTYNDQLEKLVSSQQQEAQSLQRQLKDIDVTEREILPFIQRMLATLNEFVKLDLPFLTEERRKRLEQLHLMMDDASVSIAEKYRRVMEES
jgi:seryl-tRNA synthetase